MCETLEPGHVCMHHKLPTRAIFEQNVRKNMVTTFSCICFRIALDGLPVKAITSILMLNPLLLGTILLRILQSQRWKDDSACNSEARRHFKTALLSQATGCTAQQRKHFWRTSSLRLETPSKARVAAEPGYWAVSRPAWLVTSAGSLSPVGHFSTCRLPVASA